METNKRHQLILLAAVITFGSTSAQASEPHAMRLAQSGNEEKYIVLPAGTTFEGRIDSTIGSAASHSGERFTITIANPILANGMDVLIPAGSQVIGEVVEAIPSRSIPHEKEAPPLQGKLRIQLNSLKTTEGITYPLVASLVADAGRDTTGEQTGGVGYVGDASNFEAVKLGKNSRRGNYGQGVASRDEVLRDPIYGIDKSTNRQSGSHIRSLVRRGYDLFIDSGAPLVIKLNAPFKVSLNRANLDVPLNSESTSGSASMSSSPDMMPGDIGTSGGPDLPLDIIRSKGSVHRERQESETRTHSEESKETRTMETQF
ncbi:MAG: hypothetical protein K2X29_06195 [Candidatus Obscuribacterales bacterium]|nr:hypothetical protein [Candidatus Obscuribacterales bacterium]